VALALQFAIRRVEHADLGRATLRTSMVAIWFAPATLLLYQFSPATVAAALVLVVNATRMLYIQWRVFRPAEPLPDAGSDAALVLERGELPPRILTRHLGPALSVAMVLQLGVAAVLFRQHFLAGTLLTLSAALLTVFAISTGAWESARPATMPRSIFAVLLTMALAAGLTILATGFALRGGGSDVAGGQPLPGILSPVPGSAGGPSPTPPPGQAAADSQAAGPPPLDPSDPGFEDLAGTFPGVILWPEVKPVTVLIAPMPSSPGDFVAQQRPLGIPFGGEYWLFRWPNHRPPRTSFVRRGSPSKVSFSTPDRFPLSMEAHQKLEQDIDISCCSRIEVSVLNADRYPKSVSLELILHELPGREAQSLGIEPVESVPNLESDPVKPVGETLSFQVPPEPAVREFNEMTVVYHRMNMRKDKSARIAIDRFILVPRGR